MTLSSRMKEYYEQRYKIKLCRRTPVIIRLDGKAFHTLTRGFVKPFDELLSATMCGTARYLLSEIQGAKLAYVQSDEISLLLTDFDRLETEAWFDYNLQKIVSVSAGMASAYFSMKVIVPQAVVFDSRAFNIPKEEVVNYFVWRQQDWKRNSLQMLSQAHFSSKELHGKKEADMHDMLHSKDVNWAELSAKWKNGVVYYKEGRNLTRQDNYIFSKYRSDVEKYLYDMAI